MFAAGHCSDVAAAGPRRRVLNAANEVAVAAFLAGEIPFTAIPAIIEHTLERIPVVEPRTLADVQTADRHAREIATAHTSN